MTLNRQTAVIKATFGASRVPFALFANSEPPRKNAQNIKTVWLPIEDWHQATRFEIGKDDETILKWVAIIYSKTFAHSVIIDTEC